MMLQRELSVVGGLGLALTAIVCAQAMPDREPGDARYGLLTPIPQQGGVPPIVEMLAGPTDEELAQRAKVRQYAKQIRLIRHKYLGDMRVEELRASGIAELGEFTDPAAFMPLIRELAREQDDVRLAMLDHFGACGDEGQAALAWEAIYDKDPDIRHEAVRRMTSPAPRPVLRVLDTALRSPKHRIANNAGALAGALNVLHAIPLLIFAQVTADKMEKQGDLAWIAIETQRAFVARVEAVVDNNVVVFRPIPGLVTEGVIMRVMDAVVVNYRTHVHRSLVAMTTNDWGQSTAYLGYDVRRWWQWYNSEYVPFKNEHVTQADRAGEATVENEPDRAPREAP